MHRLNELGSPFFCPRPDSPSLVFFVSGAAGLIFEIVWFNRAGLVFGNSIWAASLVLASFMAGLALGNALVRYFAHRIGRFLRVYAVLKRSSASAVSP